ncbi:hypothetical protein [Streptomyces sp. NBRC 109706]|uniref:hypothetical protein n=1 Tax=Streptomyces sp. NBRC 109706 TaxID=1550035 RepID=UPI000785C029|nr:hypothetical protein [Streptomyces sp. NBRC 109706]
MPSADTPAPTYDVVSRAADAPPGARWGLDDVSLTRTEAIAHMIMRAMRWDEGNAVLLVQRLLEGAVNPEEPYMIESADVLWDGPAGACARMYFAIVQDGQTPPEPSRR